MKINCCKWKGISCNNLTGHVTKLNLQFSDFSPVIGAKDLNDYAFGNYWVFFNTSAPLRGKLDSSICGLQHFTFLDLSVNYLERVIDNDCRIIQNK